MKIKRILVMLLMAAMIVGLCPVNRDYAYAAEVTSPGGTILTNSASNARSAFGRSAVTAAYSDGTLTITLDSDVKLSQPVVFQEGAKNDKVLLNLNGHTITGANGTVGNDSDNAGGKDALQIAFKNFDVTIQGPGQIRGGQGAMYRNEFYRNGMNGGAGIRLLGSGDYDFQPAILEHSLNITGGAQVIGGAGADNTANDWKAKIEAGTADQDHFGSFDLENISTIHAGNGGPGIGQSGTFIGSGANESYNARMESSFVKINVSNGQVAGGAGGDILYEDVLTDYQSMLGWEPMKKLGDGQVIGNLQPGTGGPGIIYYSGRKYISVGTSGIVRGGAGGGSQFDGDSKLTNSLGSSYSVNSTTGYGGPGICGYGDTGITNADVSLTSSNWNSKTATSDDIGIYIKGQVIGGDTAGTDARNINTFDAGHGIEFDSWRLNRNIDYSFDGDNPDWGILFVDTGGQVTGGSAGDTVCGDAGAGGSGIYGINIDDGECGGIIINGSVTGGNGGSTKGNMTLAAYSGKGGNGSESISSTFGKGTIKGGRGGSALSIDLGEYTDDDKSPARSIEAGNAYHDDLCAGFRSSGGTLTDGAGRTFSKKASSGISAQTTMSAITNYPDTDTELSCQVSLPSGYSGNVYYEWRMKKYTKNPVSGEKYYTSTNGNEEYTIYHNENSFNMDEGTVKEIVKTQHDEMYIDIYCYAMLDDGRYAQSNLVTINPCKIGYKDPQPVIKGSVKEVAWDHVVIQWDAPEDVDSIDGYKISRGGSYKPGFYDVSLANITKDQPREYRNDFVNVNHEGRTFYYRIKTYNSEKDSDEYYTLTVEIPFRPLPPVNTLSISQADGKVTLNWEEPELGDNYTSHNGYYVYRDGKQVADLDYARTTSWTDTSAVAGKTYTYYVTSRWPEFDESAPGNKVTVTVATAAQKACTHAATETSLTKASTSADGAKVIKCTNCNLALNMATILKIGDIVIEDASYTGSAITPEVKVYDSAGNRVADSNYSVAFANNTAVGNASATITFKGDYTGTVTKEFKILCAHANTEKVGAKAADCENAGNREYWICQDCGEYFSKADCTKASRIEDRSSVVIKAKGHQEKTVKGTPATCTEDGLADTVECGVCGAKISGGEVIPAKGHTEKALDAVEATCTEAGNSGTVVCAECGETLRSGEIIPAKGHKFNGNKCEDCDYEISIEEPVIDPEINVEGDLDVEVDVADLLNAAEITSVDEIISNMKLTGEEDLQVSVSREVTMSVDVQEVDAENNSITLDIAPSVKTSVTVTDGGDLNRTESVTDEISHITDGKSVSVRVPLPFGEAGDAVYITLNMGDKAYLFESVIDEDEAGFFTVFDNNIGFSVIQISKTEPVPVFDPDAKAFKVGDKTLTSENVTEEDVEIIKERTCFEDGSKLVRAVVVVNGIRYESDPYETVDKAPGQHTPEAFTIKAGYCKDGKTGEKCSFCGEILESKVLPGYSNYYVKSFKVAKAKKAFTAKWKKQSKANLKNFNGYQVQYSVNANMAGAKAVTAGKSSKSKKISKLLPKKKYYVRVRTYRIAGGKAYYSKWSPVKSVTTK